MKERRYLIALRILKSWSRKEVAEKLGISRSYYCMIEKGTRVPSIQLVIKMENLFGVPLVDYFFGLERNGMSEKEQETDSLVDDTLVCAAGFPIIKKQKTPKKILACSNKYC